MERIKFLIFLGIMPLLVSCLSIPFSDSKSNTKFTNLDPHQFDFLKIGQSSEEVKKNIGEPSEIRTIDDSQLWIYNDHDEFNTQRGTITFNNKTQLVSSVTVIPRDYDPEINLSYLKEQKFQASNFVEVPLQKCKHDYIPNEVFYISILTGIIIRVNSQFNSVDSYGWTSKQFASELIDKIKNCQR